MNDDDDDDDDNPTRPMISDLNDDDDNQTRPMVVLYSSIGTNSTPGIAANALRHFLFGAEGYPLILEP